MISELLKRESIIVDLKGSTKEEVLKELIELGGRLGCIGDKEMFYNKILELENLGSSALEKGVAIPHIRDNFISEIFLLFGISKQGAQFDSIDGQPSKLIFFIGAKRNDKAYLPLLSRISRMCSYAENREALLAARTEQEIIDIIKKWEG